MVWNNWKYTLFVRYGDILRITLRFLQILDKIANKQFSRNNITMKKKIQACANNFIKLIFHMNQTQSVKATMKRPDSLATITSFSPENSAASQASPPYSGRGQFLVSSFSQIVRSAGRVLKFRGCVETKVLLTGVP